MDELKRIRQLELMAAAIVENSDDAIIGKTLDGVIVTWNSAAEKLYGYSRHEAVGRHINLIAPLDRASEMEEILSLIRKGIKVDHFETQRMTKDGALVEVSLTVSPIREQYTGRIIGASAIARDIGDRKRLEQLHKLLAEAKMARELAVKEALLKSELIKLMSHELRTPLAQVIGLSDLLLNAGLRESHRLLLADVQKAAEALLALVDDVLDMQAAELGNLTVDESVFSVREVAGGCVAQYELAARAKKLTLALRVDSRVPETVVGDVVRVRKVLCHLLSNAVKFSRNGPVELVVLPAAGLPGEKSALQFRVSDSGIGISAEERERLFLPLTQADSSSTRPFSGIGLGLAVSRAIVELMGGEMGVESDKGKGSTFWFNLPLRESGCELEESTAPLGSQ